MMHLLLLILRLLLRTHHQHSSLSPVVAYAAAAVVPAAPADTLPAPVGGRHSSLLGAEHDGPVEQPGRFVGTASVAPGFPPAAGSAKSPAEIANVVAFDASLAAKLVGIGTCRSATRFALGYDAVAAGTATALVEHAGVAACCWYCVCSC